MPCLKKQELVFTEPGRDLQSWLKVVNCIETASLCVLKDPSGVAPGRSANYVSENLEGLAEGLLTQGMQTKFVYTARKCAAGIWRCKCSILTTSSQGYRCVTTAGHVDLDTHVVRLAPSHTHLAVNTKPPTGIKGEAYLDTYLSLQDKEKVCTDLYHSIAGLVLQEVMLRRLKRDVMAELPPKRRQVVRLPRPKPADWPNQELPEGQPVSSERSSSVPASLTQGNVFGVVLCGDRCPLQT